MTPSAVLYAPEQYWRLSKEARQAITNGCGTAGWLGKLVPDSIWFLDIKPLCNIHDYMYAVGETEEDKRIADVVFRNNLIRWIEANTDNKILLRLRLNRVKIYYEAVEHFGGPAFWHGKNKPEEMGVLTLADVAV